MKIRPATQTYIVAPLRRWRPLFRTYRRAALQIVRPRGQQVKTGPRPISPLIPASLFFSTDAPARVEELAWWRCQRIVFTSEGAIRGESLWRASPTVMEEKGRVVTCMDEWLGRTYCRAVPCMKPSLVLRCKVLATSTIHRRTAQTGPMQCRCGSNNRQRRLPLGLMRRCETPRRAPRTWRSAS